MENTFNKKNLLELRKMSIEQLKNYYLELRKYEYDNKVPLDKIKIRKKIHSLLLAIIKIDRILSKETIKVIDNKSRETSKPKIFACTHIGGNDIQRTFEAMKKHAYLFLGDPEGLYKDISGLLLHFNGVICLETRNKNDRFIAKERAIELLLKGGNLLIYPEGAWNITDNLPVLKLYSGAVKMAVETGAELIPIAIEQYDNKFLVNIGENLIVEPDNIEKSNQYLRDALATLKWEIWETNEIVHRCDISDDYGNMFKQNIIDKCEYGFTIEDVYETMYKSKDEVSPEEVFAFRKKLIQ